MKTYLNKIHLLLKSILFSKKSPEKEDSDLYKLIERKWWMGDDLFTDQKTFLVNPGKTKNIS
ncbi:MAG: hypothetical protein QM594_18300 [Niabella sp.]